MIICFIVKQTQIYHLCGYVYPQILLLIWGEDMHHWLVLPVCFVCFVSKRGVNSNTFPTLFSIHLQKGPYSLYVMSFPLHIFSLKSSKNLSTAVFILTKICILQTQIAILDISDLVWTETSSYLIHHQHDHDHHHISHSWSSDKTSNANSEKRKLHI